MSRESSATGVPDAKSGLIHLASRHSVEDTLQRLDALLRQRRITVFATIDHSGEAEKAGLKMRPTKLLVFGSPKLGTPVMQAVPSVAIDLPLKALIWEDEHGKVWLTYNDPEYLRRRHDVPAELLPNIGGANSIMAKAVE